MIKTILKETLIMLLLCVAIVLILGILFYDYIPTNRVIPTKEAYFTPENVKQELNEQITEIEKTEVSYEITDADLNLYKKSSSYKPGKPDPFSLPETQPASNSNEEAQGNNSTENTTENNDTQTGNNNQSTNENSTNTFFDDGGMK